MGWQWPSGWGSCGVSAGWWARYVAAADTTDGAGQYHLDLAPGSYVVCIANLSDRDPNGRPAAVAGCTPVDVRADGETPLELRVRLQGLVSQP